MMNIMNKKTFLTAVCAPALAAFVLIGPAGVPKAHAQDIDLSNRSYGSDVKSDFLSQESAVQVTVGEEKEEASLRLSYDSGPHLFTAVLTSPIDEDTERADFFGFDGFNSAAALKLGYTRWLWPKVKLEPTTADEEKAFVKKKLEGCMLVLRTVKDLDDLVSRRGQWPDALEVVAKEVREMTLPSAETVREFVENPEKYDNISEDVPKTQEAKTWKWLGQTENNGFLTGGICSEDVMLEAYANLNIDKKLVFQRLAAGKTVNFINFAATAGRQTFKFFDPVNLEAESKREIARGLEVGFGWVFLSDLATLDNSIAFTFRAEEGYEAADSVTVCEAMDSPVPDRTVETCMEMPLGAPNEIDSTFFGFEWRSLQPSFGRAGRANFATGLRVYYRGIDGEEDDFGMDIPFYFLPNADGKLSGGLRIGWSDLGGETFSVFVGTPLGSLLPGR